MSQSLDNLSVLVAANILYEYIEKHYNRFTEWHIVGELGSRETINDCYAETSLTNSVHLGVFLLIVFHEFILFHCCIYDVEE